MSEQARSELHDAITEALTLHGFGGGTCARIADAICADPRVLPLIEEVGSEERGLVEAARYLRQYWADARGTNVLEPDKPVGEAFMIDARRIAALLRPLPAGSEDSTPAAPQEEPRQPEAVRWRFMYDAVGRAGSKWVYQDWSAEYAGGFAKLTGERTDFGHWEVEYLAAARATSGKEET